MDLTFVTADTRDFDSSMYIRILIAIAKADPDNGRPEFDYVRRQALRLGVDYNHYFNNTDKSYIVKKHTVSRLTAMAILADAIMLASLDGHFSLPEKQRVYTYAEDLDIARKDVDMLEELIQDFLDFNVRWNKLTASR